ncbi:MAG: hypothetical protein HY608_01850, partial [Planctomycetes bacterium]|nr:hypothetical protein [Planctomycetota bacterium]
MFGRFLRRHGALPRGQRLYAAVWGAPFVGMRCRASIVMPLLRTLPFTRALDAGCGPGAFS